MKEKQKTNGISNVPKQIIHQLEDLEGKFGSLKKSLAELNAVIKELEGYNADFDMIATKVPAVVKTLMAYQHLLNDEVTKFFTIMDLLPQVAERNKKIIEDMKSVDVAAKINMYNDILEDAKISSEEVEKEVA